MKEEVDLTRTPQEIEELKQEEMWKSLSPERIQELSEQFKITLGDIYERIIYILKRFVDLKEEYYILAAIWVIGTYLHKSFSTYPYLYLNAMRGSGKSRMLNILASLSMNGRVIGSPTEAILFRSPQNETLLLDEYEGITRKGNEGVREILNSAYKRGLTIRRMKQVKVNGSTEQVIEEFEPYKPIAMANIWGMEEVLGDRCITLTLEKSDREDINRILENFDKNYDIKWVKWCLEANLVYLVKLFQCMQGVEKWNFYLNLKYHTLDTLDTLHTQDTQDTLKLTDEEVETFNKIYETGINGRNLELFFPLLLIGKFISEESFDSILKIASKLTKEKRKEEMVESKDVSFIDFVSSQEPTLNYKSIRALTISFRNFLGTGDNEDKWINESWVGRALRRLNLIVDKRRVSGGIEVTLDIQKAKQKMERFK